MFDEAVGGPVSDDVVRFAAQLATDRDRSLAAFVLAFTCGLDGQGVHVMTIDDSRARNDAELYNTIAGNHVAAAGKQEIAIGLIYAGQPMEEKQAAYRARITVGSVSQFDIDQAWVGTAIVRASLPRTQFVHRYPRVTCLPDWHDEHPEPKYNTVHKYRRNSCWRFRDALNAVIPSRCGGCSRSELRPAVLVR